MVGKKRIDSSSDNKCPQCKKKIVENHDGAIQCNMCEEWFHTTCAQIESDHNKILGKYNSVYWFCKVCEPKLKTLLNREVNDIATSVTASIEKLSAEQEQQKENMVSIRNEVSKINSTIIPILKTVESSITKTYAEAAITTKKITSHSTLRNYTKPISPPNRANSANIVIVDNVAKIDSVKSSVAIRREFAKYHPRIKLNQAVCLASGAVLLNFVNPEDASEVILNWKTKCIGEETTARHPKSAKMKLIIKNLDDEINNEEASICIQNTYKDATVERFKKRDGKIPNTAAISFTNETSFHQAKEQGVFIKNQHYQTEEYKDRPRAIRCYNCQKFGHSAKLCNNKQRCAKCSDHGHNSEACPKTEVKCANCDGCHVSYSTSCPVYRRTLLKLYELRNIETPRWLLTEGNDH